MNEILLCTELYIQFIELYKIRLNWSANWSILKRES